MDPRGAYQQRGTVPGDRSARRGDRARAGDGITVMGVRSLYPWVPEPLRGRMPRPSEYVCDGCISRPLVLGWWAQEEEMMLARRSVFWLSGKLLRVIDRDR